MNIFLDTKGATSSTSVDFDGARGLVNTQNLVETTSNCGYSLDIADKVMDNNAYGQGKTNDDIMQAAGNTNARVQKDFMVVMSNTVSGEDYQKMMEEGFDANSTDVETYVSIVDQIKVTLAEAGVDVAGFTDNIDADVAAEILGNVSSANALLSSLQQNDLPVSNDTINEFNKLKNDADKIEGLSDDALKYMIKNNKTPNVENLYLAQFSSAKTLKQANGYFGESIGNSVSYFAKKADTSDVYGLDKQIEKVVEESGLEVNEETIEQGKWLVLSGIECTSENLQQLNKLENIEFPISEEKLINVTVNALKQGIEPKKMSLVNSEDIDEKASRIYEEVQKITDDDIKQVIDKDEKINIKNLIKEENADSNENLNKEVFFEDTSNLEKEIKYTEAKANLEETRLLMSVEANKELLKKGIQIDVTDLSELVEDLRQSISNMKVRLYQGADATENEDRESIYNETVEKTNDLKEMPLALVGMHIKDISSLNINELHKEGSDLQKTYEKANESYETLMTKPRSDLGDKIQKAFQNVDDILEDMEIEVTDENERAVRILGYNSMEITESNISAVKEADQSIQQVIKRMNPATTLEMIRDNKNPLEMSLNEINEYLDEKEEDSGASEEKFSKFLQKLDRSGKITEDERKAYIGIYRMFRQIEKTDGAAVGSLVNANMEINFKNMLTAVRTGINKKIDISIDEEYGALEKLISKNSSISKDINDGFAANNITQSEEYYGELAGEIAGELANKTNIEDLKKIEIKEETTIETFSDEIKTVSEGKSQEQVVADFQSFKEEIKEANEMEEAVLERLVDMDLPISVDNINAMNEIIENHGIIFKEVFKQTDKDIVEELKDSKTAKKAYEKLTNKAKETVHNIADSSSKLIDVKACKSMCKTLSFANQMAKKESFMIPVDLEGEETIVNLDIYHDSHNKGKVSITLDNENLGKVGAELKVTEDKVSGMVVYEETKAKENLQNIKENFKTELQNDFENDINVSINLVQTKNIDFYSYGTDRNNDSSLSTKDLYTVAKAFLKALKKG